MSSEFRKPGAKGKGSTKPRRAPRGAGAPRVTSAQQARYDRIQAMVDEVDNVARAHENEWGVGRLEQLVDAATRGKWYRLHSNLADALWPADGADPDETRVREIADQLVAGWPWLAGKARAAGHKPLEVEAWSAAMDDGRALVVVRSQAEAHALAGTMEGAVVYTVDELARLVCERLRPISDAKEMFPGAEVSAVRHGRDTTGARGSAV